MRISAKGRYALAALIEIARQTRSGELASVVSISDTLGISKLFLEQVAALLKKSGIIVSTKGAKGGYQLSREAKLISVLEVLRSVENTLFEKSDYTVAERAPATEAALREKVFATLDKSIEACLSRVTLHELLDYADQQNIVEAYMMYM